MDPLFPVDRESRSWQEFPAMGFSQPVCGVIYRAGESLCGIPLGGIGTGCIDLNTDGTLGRASIFNSFTPPRELGVPFLTLSQGEQIWTLTTDPEKAAHPIQGIAYWGHYPVADLEYETGGPISVGLRAWSPFLPGFSELSNTPGAVFEVHLRNTSRNEQQGTLTFSFSG